MPKKIKDTVLCHSQNDFLIFENRGCFMFGYLAVGDTDGRGKEVATDSEL
jgi:hypothetical protein